MYNPITNTPSAQSSGIQPASFKFCEDSFLNINKSSAVSPHLRRSSSRTRKDFYSPQQEATTTIYSPATRGSQTEHLSDRYIPFRITNSAKNLYELAQGSINNANSVQSSQHDLTKEKLDYTSLLNSQVLDIEQSDIFGNFVVPQSKPSLIKMSTPKKRDDNNFSSSASQALSPKSKVLQFKTPKKKTLNRYTNVNRSLFMDVEGSADKVNVIVKPQRKDISRTPCRVLDAPCLLDDFYLTLLHWSQRNQLAVSLGQAVWIWAGDTGEVSKFCSKEEYTDLDYTALQWDPEGNLLTAGLSDGSLEIWDHASGKQVYQGNHHTSRIDCISWNNPNVFSTGGRDTKILTFDLRAANSPVACFQAHTDEVCGLKWSPNGSLLASGGNDNKAYIWNAKKQVPELTITQHHSAVKALTWSPHQQHFLLTGGGYIDKKIRVWNTISMNMVSEIDAESQVCNLLFSKNSNEFVSTHGLTGNQIILWDFASMKKTCVIDGPQSHSERVLYLSGSPDGQTIVTGASDETLKFWNIFPEAQRQHHSSLLLSASDLR